jgi:CubicO group peptidase (beta-lactamase class C family)
MHYMKMTSHRNRIVLLLALWVSSAGARAHAGQLVVPQAEQVRQAMEQYVEDSRLARGVVVGVVQDGRRAIYSHGTSGRTELELSGDTLFEIGSISKVFTGLLLAEMVLAGDVRYSDTVAELAPEQYTFAEGVGSITLQELATHTSGLPRLAMDAGPLLRGLFASDPYAGSTPDEIFRSVASLSDAQLQPKGVLAYSNLGYGLLGQLLAVAAGQDYESLLTERVLVPLQIGDMAFGPGQAEPALLAQGFNRGRAAEHWNLDAYTPAGGLVASSEQMLDFVQANLRADRDFVAAAQRSPGQSTGATPRTLGIGYAHRNIEDQPWLWHNGGTGGFSSYFGFAPTLDFGIVVLANGTGKADRLAEVLIRTEATPLAPHKGSWFGILMALMGVVIAPLALSACAFARTGANQRPSRTSQRRPPDRLDLLVVVVAAAMLLVVSRSAGDWISIPFYFWWLGLFASTVAALALIRARFAQRAWRTGGVPSLLGRLLIVALFLMVMLVFT